MRQRHKLIATLMAFCFLVCSILPTIALAHDRPPQRRPPSRSSRQIKRPPIQDRMKYSMAKQQKRYHNRHHYNRVIHPNRRYQKYRYDARYYYYNGYRYHRGIYSGWYHNRHYSMHGDDWIAMIGTVAFFAALTNMNNSSGNTIVVDSDRNIVYVD